MSALECAGVIVAGLLFLIGLVSGLVIGFTVGTVLAENDQAKG